jgi:hypothetical protein
MSAESEGGQCPVCEGWVEDYEPGVSAIKIDGVFYHPSCAIREGLAIGEAEEYAANNGVAVGEEVV